MSMDSLCRWKFQVSVYCARRIFRCTQCSILLRHIDICFLPCICLWQISQIQTCLCVVVGPGFVSTSTVLMRCSASHPAGPHDRLATKNGKLGSHCLGREVSTQFAQQFVNAGTALPLVGCDTNINKLQITQNTALRNETGCTTDTNTQHLHD